MMRFAIAGASMVAATSAMGQVVMDFDAYEFANGGVVDIGTVLMEDGFSITKGDNEPFNFAVFAQDDARYPGSAAPFNNTVDGLIRLTQDNGNAFDLESIMLSNLNNNGPVTTMFTGFVDGGGTVFSSYTTSGGANGLELHTFGDDFNNVVAVEWTQASPFHQFDQISIIPAPGAVALLGLGGLAAIRRRR